MQAGEPMPTLKQPDRETFATVYAHTGDFEKAYISAYPDCNPVRAGELGVKLLASQPTLQRRVAEKRAGDLEAITDKDLSNWLVKEKLVEEMWELYKYCKEKVAVYNRSGEHIDDKMRNETEAKNTLEMLGRALDTGSPFIKETKTVKVTNPLEDLSLKELALLRLESAKRVVGSEVITVEQVPAIAGGGGVPTKD